MSHSFTTFALLISIPSEISVLSYSSIYSLYKHSSKKACGWYLASSWKTVLLTIVKL